MTHQFDAVIVGAGGAGLMGALWLVQPFEQSSAKKKPTIAVVSKLYPTRSHTGAAQGGIGAALGNLENDSWEWHMFDTVKGSDYLADQDAVEIMCREAIETVYELEHWGLPFNRTPDGKIDQRRFGGHTRELGKGPVRRSCYAADRTGHMILQTLYQQCLKHEVTFFDEFHLMDLLMAGDRCVGLVALEIATGALHVFQTKAVLLATGGFGRMYQITSNAHALTGDGVALAYQRGIPLEDMEFFQFHPTGIYKMGILLSEAARGEGGILRNGEGEQFMQRYAATLLDLAPRDMISRSIYLEIRAGRGVNGQDYVLLDLTHLGRKVIESKLPDITDFVRTYLGIDPVKAPIPIQPTAHYAMGGIPTNVRGQVILDAQGTSAPGLYAAGECACVSVHGANRLGTNSLVDILVFGRRAGRAIAESLDTLKAPPLPKNPEAPIREKIAQLFDSRGTERVATIRSELQQVMMDHVSVFREASGLTQAQEKIQALKSRMARVTLSDRGLQFNTELLEALELVNLLALAEVTAACALIRQESRGAHFREDFPKRDDGQWLKHTLATRAQDGSIQFSFKSVSITRFAPQERKY
ncbi:MAG: succinate dehydrogenase flavoprotein subunit [Elusimicrobia bacterium]|nr:succinate dehydrogenase flavoprotein subunit [Elusimicrobiota bacterium]